MRRGTRVGQAYVAVTADGDGINEEIVDAVDDAGDGVADSGERHGKRYGTRFSKGFRKHLDDMRGKVADRLSKQMGHAGGNAGDEAGETFVERVSEKVKQKGDRIGQALGDRMASRPEQMRRGIHRAFDDEFADRIGQRFGDRIADSLEQRLSTMDLDTAVSRSVGGGRAGRRDLIGDRIGLAFGARSRNNALNLLGRTIGKTVNMAERLRRTGAGIGRVFVQGFTQAAEGANAFQKTLSGFRAIGAAGATKFGAAMRAIAKSGPAAAVAIVAVIAAMSALASAAGAVLGILTAMTGTIVSGLAGGLTVLSGLMFAGAAAAGLLTAAFMSMTDAQQDMLKRAFQPLKAEMVGIGQIMLRDMVPAFATWSSNLQEALLLAVPAAQRMGAAFAEAGNRLTASLSGPGFQRFAAAMATHLPNIVTKMSSALGAFMNGLLGMFSAVTPMVVRFAGYLEQVATRFSDWANSTKGQHAISDWTARAVESLESLWGFVREFFGFLQDLLFNPATQQAGNTIFDSFRDAFARFRQAIANGDLEKWFNDAIRFGSALWGVMESLGGTFMALYNSGVIASLASLMEGFSQAIQFANKILGPTVDLLGLLGGAAARAVAPIQQMSQAVLDLADHLWFLNSAATVLKVLNLAGVGGGAQLAPSASAPAPGAFIGPVKPPGQATIPQANTTMPSLQNLIDSGNKALNQTSISSGGYKPSPTVKEYWNPYKKWAESLIKSGPSVKRQIKKAVKQFHKAARQALREATKAETGAEAREGLIASAKSLREGGRALVDAAQNQLNSAAQSLAGASSAREAKRAFRRVRQAQRDLRKAQRAQQRLVQTARLLGRQKVIRSSNVKKLLDGMWGQNTTLAEIARAREIVAGRLDKANEKLAEAIALRDEYRGQVEDSVRSFGDLLSAQAQMLDGVQQALTAEDITGNLRERLQQVQDFQTNLRELLAMGLSNAAYKQLVDAGAEQGGAYAQALVEGGVGSIQELNGLLAQFDDNALAFGKVASDRMYQAGVNAAQGLVDGLESLSHRLDLAATKLGNQIAKAVKKALGIKSPSTVMIAAMDDVGDGGVIGLDRQHDKIARAAQRFSDQIAVSPEVATYAAQRDASPATVSGNGQSGSDQRFRDLVVHTPTENPEAVAMEVMNEVTGRLP